MRGVLLRLEGTRRQRNNRQMCKLRHQAQQTCRLNAAHDRHLHVHQYQINLVWMRHQPVNGFLTIAGKGHHGAVPVQNAARHFTVDVAVIHHQHPYALQRFPSQIRRCVFPQDIGLSGLIQRLIAVRNCFERHRKPELTALPQNAGQANLPAHQLDQLATNRQPKACPTKASGGRAVSLREGRKNSAL